MRTLITRRPCILTVTLPSITQYRTSQGDCMLATKFMYILIALYSISFIDNAVNVDFWVGRKDCDQNDLIWETIALLICADLSFVCFRGTVIHLHGGITKYMDRAISCLLNFWITFMQHLLPVLHFGQKGQQNSWWC